jgi:Zn-finger nucleic acid-binding protein
MSTPTQALSCPKCQSEMRSYERNGVTVDQCTGCRGVFLDRGELERLIDAESSHYGDEREPRYREDDDDERAGFGRRKKRRNFLEGFFDSD